MNWRATFLSGLLAAGLTLTFVPPVAAKHYRYSNTRYDRDECSPILERIDFDRGKIDEIGPTGRHQKALRWYEEDLRNAERDFDKCRYGDVSYDEPSYGSSGSDPYYGDDPSYDDTVDRDRPFDWKRDWPELLGLFINPQN
jgi:hypothetical protein